MTAGATMLLWLATAAGLAPPAEVSALLERVGDADLAIMRDPQAERPVRVLLATRVAVRPEAVRELLAAPATYKRAMPAFRRIDVVAKRERAGGVDLQVSWELDVPLWNLEGKLWIEPQPDGVDLVLEEGGFAPGLFHLRALALPGTKGERTLLTIEGFANVAEANVAARQLAKRSTLAEPAITVAAGYVMLKSVARLVEQGKPGRPVVELASPTSAELEGPRTAAAALAVPQGKNLVAAVRNRESGRLAGVEVAVLASARAEKRASGPLPPRLFASLPGWKKVDIASSAPDTCRDPDATCWAVETNLPLFSLDGTWKIRSKPWRARLVDGDREGALMAVDVVRAPRPGGAAVVLSEHPRLDRAGFVPRKLIAAEPYLEQGLALALAMVDAASLAAALERDQSGSAQ